MTDAPRRFTREDIEDEINVVGCSNSMAADMMTQLLADCAAVDSLRAKVAASEVAMTAAADELDRKADTEWMNDDETVADFLRRNADHLRGVTKMVRPDTADHSPDAGKMVTEDAARRWATRAASFGFAAGFGHGAHYPGERPSDSDIEQWRQLSWDRVLDMMADYMREQGCESVDDEAVEAAVRRAREEQP